MRIALVLLALVLGCIGNRPAGAADENGQLITRWAADVAPDNCWQEYPRPQVKRPRWKNLNGLWDVAVLPAAEPQPPRFDKQILVPFPAESYLGGLQAAVLPHERLWYRRSFELPPQWKESRILLHFGAVDWDATVKVNGTVVGRHQGGYTPFFFDISDHVRWDGSNELVVVVFDPTDTGTQPSGKQRLKPGGIRYTATTGIWQTVWLEPVPFASVERLRITPDVQSRAVKIVVEGLGTDKSHRAEAELFQAGGAVARVEGPVAEELTISVPEPRLWSPADPFLYDLRVRLKKDGDTVDEVESYVGMRSVSLGQDENGITRIMLNGKPLFQFGPLDQGYWPDGLYTSPSDAALRHELSLVKRLGFNMLRKHVKVEPARWYYWCDKLGLLVWQDLPSGDRKAPWPRDGVEMQRAPESAAQFRKELQAMIDFCHNSPSVVAWIPFNEGWGQFNTRDITAWVKRYDPSRLVVSASGGNDFGVGDVRDNHFYPGPGAPPAERGRAAVLGEFGGYGLPTPGHTWKKRASWGYRSFNNKAEFASAYFDLLDRLRPLVESHLSAAVYTQLADVETEVNGLTTYDREIVKIDAEKLAAAHKKLLRPLPTLSNERRLAASTLAWWRFEEGQHGEPTPNVTDHKGAIGAYDVSGHNNHLFAYSPHTAPQIGPVTYKCELGPLPYPNRNVLADTLVPSSEVGVRDLYTAKLLSRTRMDALDAYPLSEWTIEASFAFAADGAPQIIISKKGRPTDMPYPPFQLGVFKQNGPIWLQIIDGSGQLRTVESRSPAQLQTWYHVAATCDGSVLKLFVKPDGQSQYTLEDETNVDGALIKTTGNWALGRGFYDGRIDFDAQALIDEVRISVAARPKEEFLFAP